MSETKIYTGGDYDIIAWYHDQDLIYYERFGSYQGDWIMVTVDSKNYSIYKDYFGSCSGCDAYEAEFGYGDEKITMERAKKFVENYKPFAIVPIDTMINLCRSGNLSQIFPLNIRDTYGDIDYDEAIHDISIRVKVNEKMTITPDEILKTRNAEIKQEALAYFGYENFIKEIKPETIHSDGENSLLKIDDIVLLNVKDASTSRRYLLRVPDNMKTVRGAIAWTFNMRESEYNPIVET